MNTLFSVLAGLVTFFLTFGTAMGQSFVGTNAPGTGTNFSFTLNAAATNLSLVVSNTTTNTAWLLLKRGGTPTDTDFDFISRMNGRTNHINLQLPELTAGSYGLRVRTPAASSNHAFRVTMTTNRSDLRSTNYPVLKPLVFSTTGTLTTNAWHFFQVDMPSNQPGWRVVLSHTGAGNPDLYIRRGQVPTQFTSDKSSVGQTNDTILFTDAEGTNHTYFIGVFLPGTAAGAANYTLSAELGYVTTLTWDPGTNHFGGRVFTNMSASGGDYFFKITTQTPNVGAWRTALRVTGGEADVYLRQGPGFDPVPANFSRKSQRIGSDGFVLNSTEFAAAQDWFMVVRATPGAAWTLYSGDVFVQNLGNLLTNGLSSSGPVDIGPEGMRFFRTSSTAGTLAWRLWLNGATNEIFVRKTAVPHPLSTGTHDLRQSRQMLVVPNYFNAGDSYFVSTVGNPGDVVNLDSRIQDIGQIPFSSTTNLTFTGYGYRTFRVQVPVQQIAWLTSLIVSNGNGNVAVRRDLVPNEWNNDAFSEAPGLITDSVSLVPPTLSDGTFYVTVYGLAPYSGQLASGNPVITDVGFVSTTLNADVNRVGWRYFRVPDIASQLGSLGWDLLLQNQPPGTELAIRRNAVPSRWNYRPSNNANVSSQGFVDFTDQLRGFLQRPGHQADIWYIGVYNPSNALGPFTLVLDRLQATALSFNSGAITRTAVPAFKWQYFRVDVPTNALGWDVRLINVPAGPALPRMMVRRDQLPDGLSHIGWTFPENGTTWPSGNQWAANSDWTDRNDSPDGSMNESRRILAMGQGRPLEPGSYYVGVNNDNANDMTFTVQSRGIGPGQTIGVNPLAFTGGTHTTNGVPPREAVYYRVDVPSNAPSWKLRFTASAGESMLAILRNTLPNVRPSTSAAYDANSAGAQMRKLNDEHFVLLPREGDTNIPAGAYYIAAISEGVVSNNTTRIGSGTSGWTLTSVGPLPVASMGTVGAVDLTTAGALAAGEVAAHQFNVPPGTLAMEVRLENRVGNPQMALRWGTNLPAPQTGSYGQEGGWTSGRTSDDRLLNVANPSNGVWSVTVKANITSTLWSNATYTLRVRALVASNLVFNGGTVSVTNQEAATWRYFRVEVPTNAFGWDVRLINVATNCDAEMVVRRDLAPFSLANSGWTFPQLGIAWPSGNQWGAGADWTGRANNPAGNINENSRILAMGQGRPLQPGIYFVGVSAGSGTNALAYTVQSRGIGTNMVIPIYPLAYAGGAFTSNSLPAREAAYFRVVIPTNTLSWKIRLATNMTESLLLAAKEELPNITPDGTAVYSSSRSGAFMRKEGNEHFVLLPQDGATNIPAATYYLAVVSEGTNTTNSARIGTGNAAFTLTSQGPLPITAMGTVGPADLVTAGALEGGEIAAYQFNVPPGTLSLAVRLENRTGDPRMALRPGANPPTPNATTYGDEGGQPDRRFADSLLINVANPSNGVYTLLVKANATSSFYSNATYTVRVQAVTAAQLTFNGGSLTVSNQPADTWSYFLVNVPSNAVGWDLRLINVPTNGGLPRLVVRRNELPQTLSTAGWTFPYQASTWPSGNAWAPPDDWTGRRYSPDGNTDEYGRILAMGLGRPLSPGQYYVGVINASGTNAMSYTILSRGIGAGFVIPITPLAFAGGTVSNPGIVAREAAYYSVVIPSNTPSWKLRLTNSAGESQLIVNRERLPNITPNGEVTTTNSASGQSMQKAGNEHFLLLADEPQSFVAAGTYYIAVVSEGINTTNASRIGAGSASFSLVSQGVLPVLDLGTLGAGELRHTNALQGGEFAAYRFRIAPGTDAVQTRLDNRVGRPAFAQVFGTNLPTANVNGYGSEGGWNTTRLTTETLVTMAGPSNGVYSVLVKASEIQNMGVPDASYVLRVRRLPIEALNFAPNFNTNGFSNRATNLLADNERWFYRVVVPATNVGVAFGPTGGPLITNAHPVIGWRLNLSTLSGQAQMRVRKLQLPSDVGPNTQTTFVNDQAVIVPPYLTPGEWFVEVKGNNSTAYTITSDELLLERPAWNQPQRGAPVTTPGLSAPTFGDSGVNTGGSALPGDQGIDLASGAFHYYAVNVPTNNGGLMRVALEAISGNPDYYLRFGAPPTLTHGPAGQTSPFRLVDREFTGTATQYANWVPEDSRYEHALTNGVWYMAIRAGGGSNVRYRMRLTTGTITDLGLNGNAVGQIIAAGDWRYYRFTVPTNAPQNWNVSFQQIVGDVVMYVRDTVPPGQFSGLTTYRDWNNDGKNHGPYPSYDAQGLYQINCPPWRPGHTYYLGFRAVNDATFNITTAASASNIDVTNVVAFYGGITNTILAPNGVLRFRVDVPPDARRWMHFATNVAGVRIYIDQGSLPTLTSSDHYNCNSANCTFNTPLYGANNWPWLPGYMYFVSVTNTTGVAQPFTFRMNGKDCTTDDNDNDLLPDCWEVQYFGNTSQTGSGDPDGDGFNNLQEYQNLTDPTVFDVSPFFLTDPMRLPSGRFQALFVGAVNRNYRVQTSTNLLLTGWTDITNFLQTTPTRIITDAAATNRPHRFYRAVTP